jgi:hypothetical protein
MQWYIYFLFQLKDVSLLRKSQKWPSFSILPLTSGFKTSHAKSENLPTLVAAKIQLGCTGTIVLLDTGPTGTGTIALDPLNLTPVFFSRNFFLEPEWRSSIGRCKKFGDDP